MITHMFISLTMDQKKKPLNTENAICGHLFQTIMSAGVLVTEQTIEFFPCISHFPIQLATLTASITL